MKLDIIGDQEQRKFDEGLVNQVNAQAEADQRREELEKRREELQTRLQPNQEPQTTQEKETKSKEEKPVMLLPEDCIFLEATGHLSADGQILYSYPDTMIAQDTMYPGLNWNQTHKVLQSQGLAMPTIRQEIDRMILIQSGLTDTPVYDGNLKPIKLERLQQLWNKYFSKQQQGWNGRWLDAQFKLDKTSGLMVLTYKTISTINPQEGQILTPKRIETLEAFVNKNTWINLLDSTTYQGLPTKKTTDEHFYFAKPRENSVALFFADAGRAGLVCYWNPYDTNAALAVCPTQKILPK